jgi:twitching motility protein PilT
MSERRLINPELDRLVEEMNLLTDDGQPLPPADAEAGLDPASLREVAGGEPLEALLTEMVRRGGSDLLLVPGTPPVLRIDGRLTVLDAEPVEDDGVRTLLGPHLGLRASRVLAETGSVDLPLRLSRGPEDEGGWRMRVNVHRQRGRLAAAIRALARRVPTLEELNLPPELARLVEVPHGLILVCGPTGCGKSTTLAALLGVINRSQVRHVITIEDPVEYEHRNRRSIFEQVEIGRDAPTFGGALRAALRRDPDVILVGEMRDLETMSTAVTAAETGHLILSTLHVGTATQAVHRIVDVFPASQQDQVRLQLALSLEAVICQQLLPRANGRGRVPAVEVLVATHAVRNHIRSGRIEQLYNELVVGAAEGMQTMERSLASLVGAGSVAAEVARARTSRPTELNRFLNG